MNADQKLLVKVRWPGEKRWFFSAPDGTATTRRVHAALCTPAEADRTVELIHDYDPTVTIRVQTWDAKVLRTIDPKQEAA